MASDHYAKLLQAIANAIEELGEDEILSLTLAVRARLVAQKKPRTGRKDIPNPLTPDQVNDLLLQLALLPTWQDAYRMLHQRSITRSDLVKIARAARSHATKVDAPSEIKKRIAVAITK